MHADHVPLHFDYTASSFNQPRFLTKKRNDGAYDVPMERDSILFTFYSYDVTMAHGL